MFRRLKIARRIQLISIVIATVICLGISFRMMYSGESKISMHSLSGIIIGTAVTTAYIVNIVAMTRGERIKRKIADATEIKIRAKNDRILGELNREKHGNNYVDMVER